MTVLTQASSKEKRSVYIDSSDAKDRQVSAIYRLPMPVWKSSYRRVFAEQGQPTLEGWAIVDNTTADDWTNVRLAVVSGRPVSFISKLYEPKYVQRQTVDLAEAQVMGPVVYAGAMSQQAPAAPPPESAKMMAAPLARRQLRPQADQEMGRAEAISNIAVNTEAREL